MTPTPRSSSIGTLSARLLFCPVLAGAALIGTSHVAWASPITIVVQQLTFNSKADTSPAVSGANVVWQGAGGSDNGTDTEIFRYDGVSTTQLTVNAIADANAEVSNAGVLWERGSGATGEIMFHNGVSESNPSNANGVADTSSFLAGNRAVWTTGPGTALEIATWTSASPTILTTALPPASVVDRLPHTDGTNVVWARGSAGGFSIQKWDGTSISPVATSTTNLEDPKVAGQNTVWEGVPGGGIPRQVFFNDGTQTIQLSTQDLLQNNDPQISGSHVAWMRGAFGTASIQLYDIAANMTQTIFSADVVQNPQIWGQFVVWQAQLAGQGDTEIFLWDGNEVHQVTDNAYNDTVPKISGTHIAWQGQFTQTGPSPANTIEIFHANFIVPEPSTLVLAGMGLAGLMSAAKRRRPPR